MTSYWWFRPSRIALLMVMPLAIAAYLASNAFYQRFGSTNAITDDRFFLMWLSILAFAGASWVGEILVPTRPDPSMVPIAEASYQRVQYALSTISILAILVFLAPFAERPDLVVKVLTGEPGVVFEARGLVNQIPGITSQENLFSLAVVLFMLKRKVTGRRLTKVEKAVLALILLLTAIKVFMHGERLALLELLVPMFVLIAALRKRSVLWALAPPVGVGCLFLFFAGTEYLRSWVAYYADRSDSLFDFALYRMIGYYITAFNNGSFVYGEEHSYFFPVYTGGWMWRLPIPGLEDFLQSVTGAHINISELLAGQNIEFNNVSGIFAPLLDFGPVVGIVVWLVLGFVSGRLFRRFTEGRPLGLILFPTWYIGVLEMARVFYWGDNRYFPPLVVSVGVGLVFARLSAVGHAGRSRVLLNRVRHQPPVISSLVPAQHRGRAP